MEKPFRPLTPFLTFSSDYRKYHPNMSDYAVIRKAANIWSNMTDEDKIPFIKIFEERVLDYKEKMSKYEKENEISKNKFLELLPKSAK